MDTTPSQQMSSVPDLSALIAAMPEALSMLSTMPTVKPSSAFSTGDIPNLLMSDPMNATLSMMLLQQQQHLLLSTFNPFAFGSIPAGLNLSGQSALDALALANDLMRPGSQSAVPSPKNSITCDMRPRAFSSAATLQPSLLPNDKRRKRSHQDYGQPTGRGRAHTSVLRGLVESDEEPMAMQLAPPTRMEDERIKMDVARVAVLSRTKEDPPPRKKSPVDNSCLRLRPLIRDEDLPDSVGPDSPFRHHPKYQKKNFGLSSPDHMDAVAMAVVSGFWPGTESGVSSVATSTAESSPKGTTEYQSNSPLKTFNEILDQTLVRELVAAE